MDQWRRTYSGEPHDFSPLSSIKKSAVSDSIDKDDLIDEMQSKIGELLQVNQELYKAKNQIELLKETLSVKEQQFLSEKESLEDELEQTKQELLQKNNEVEEYHDKLVMLQDENNTLRIKVKELKRSHEEALNMSEEDAKRKIDETKSILQSKLSDSSEEVSQLQSQLADLQAEIDLKSSVLQMAKSKLEETSNDNLEQKMQNSNLKDEITGIKAELEEVKNTNADLQRSNFNKDGEIQSLKAEISSLKAELCEKQKQFIPMKEALSTIQQYCSNSTKPCEVAAFIEYQMQVKNDLQKSNEELSKKILDLVSKNSKLEQDLMNSMENEMELRKANQDMAEDLQECRMLMGEIEDRLVYVQELDKVRHKIDASFKHSVDTLETIRNTLLGTYPSPSFRSILLATLSLRAWMKPKNDSPGVMWLPPVSSLQVDRVALQTVSDMATLSNKLKVITDELQDMENALAKAAEDREAIQDQLNSLQKENNKLKRHVLYYKEETSRLVKPEIAEKQKLKIQRLKAKLRAVCKVLEQREDEITKLTSDLHMSQSTSQENRKLLDGSEGQVKLLTKQVKTLEDEIDILRSVVDCKRKDIFSLERAVRC